MQLTGDGDIGPGAGDVRQPPGVLDDLLREQLTVAQRHLGVSEELLRQREHEDNKPSPVRSVADATREALASMRPESKPTAQPKAPVASPADKLPQRPDANPARGPGSGGTEQPARTLREHLVRPLGEL